MVATTAALALLIGAFLLGVKFTVDEIRRRPRKMRVWFR